MCISYNDARNSKHADTIIYVFHVARKHISTNNIVFRVAREHIDMVSTAPSMNLYIFCSSVTQNGLICRNISIIQ